MQRSLFIILILISTFAVMGCKITGKITENGKALEGITVTLSGDASMSTTTDEDGIYVFNQIKPGNYEVKPADDKHAFKPPSKNVKVGPKNKIARADFELVTSPPPASLLPWSTYQGNAAHTGYVPVSLNPDDFSEGWTQTIVAGATLNPVAAGDGKVFVTMAGYHGPNVAMALDSATGDALWTYDFDELSPLDPKFYIGPPAFSNGTVYIQSNNHDNDSFIWAFDAKTGAVLFSTPYHAQWYRYYAPTIYDDNVYVGGGYYGGAYSFDGVSGEELWFRELNQYDQWTPAVNEDHVIAYTGLYDPQLTVMNRLNGEVEFSILDPNFVWDGWSMNLAPVLGSLNNVIVINGGRLISFDLNPDPLARNGWEIPKEEGDVEGFSGQSSLAEGIIFAVYDGDLYALDESDGSFIDDWKPWQPPHGESIVTPMIVTDNLIFVSTESATYAVDLEKQKEQWSYAAGGYLAFSDECVLFIATAEGELHAISTIDMLVE